MCMDIVRCFMLELLRCVLLFFGVCLMLCGQVGVVGFLVVFVLIFVVDSGCGGVYCFYSSFI